MGKIEDMRRVREQQFAEAEARRAKAAKAPPGPSDAADAKPQASPKASAPVASSSASKPSASEPATRAAPGARAAPKKKADADRGECPSCGKTKPLENGVMASHQKGFGKACPGSRKPPV